MNRLTQFELGYHASAIDCEGTISITKRIREHRIDFPISVGVGNTNLILLSYLKQTSGLGNIHDGKKQDSTSKRSWVWRIQTKNIKEYLLLIKNYLVIKKQQAELMLEFLDTLDHNSNRPISNDI